MRSARPVLLLLAALWLGACQTLGGGSAPGVSGDRVQAILARGELRVGLSAAQPPFNMKTKSGELVGLDVDIVRELARAMKLRVRIVETPFAELLPALERDEVDLVISGMTITPERNARVAFAGPYFVSGKSMLTRSPELAAVHDVRSLDAPERRYAALAGSTSAGFVKAILPSARLVPVPDYETGLGELAAGEVDALIADYAVCLVESWRRPEAGFSMPMTPFTTEPLGIALPPDDPLWVNLVENHLDTLDSTGVLAQLKARWLSRGDWVSELP